jgi:hypothetical protein
MDASLIDQARDFNTAPVGQVSDATAVVHIAVDAAGVARPDGVDDVRRVFVRAGQAHRLPAIKLLLQVGIFAPVARVGRRLGWLPISQAQALHQLRALPEVGHILGHMAGRLGHEGIEMPQDLEPNPVFLIDFGLIHGLTKQRIGVLPLPFEIQKP